MAFDLNLNSILSPINENGSTTLNGQINGLKITGGEVTLDIDWGRLDLNGNPINSDNQSITIKDGGSGDLDGVANGQISFSLTHPYLDDNPTGTPSDTYTIKVGAKENFLIGTDAVFVIDRSGSTEIAAQGLTTSVGDQNGDGWSNTILDVEIASFKSLNQNLIDRGLGNIAKVSLVQFDSTAQRLDMQPGTDGFQSFTTPLADTDSNGVRDVDQVLRSIQLGGMTNYEAALQQAITAVNAAGTASGQGNVIFLSDGEPNTPGSSSTFYTDEANTIKNTLGQNLRAFGVGTGASLSPLAAMDTNAQVFTNPQQLLDVFGGAGAGTNTDSASISLVVKDVAPVLGTLNDNLPNSGIIVQGDTLTLSASFTDVGTLDTHTGSINWGDGKTDSLGTVVGTVGGSHVYTTVGSYTATLTVKDDDTLSDSDSIGVIVAKKVNIDWKPGSNPSSMNFTGGGTIPVAVLGAADFNVLGVNVASIRADDQKDVLLNGGGVGVNRKNNGTLQFSYEDTNSDGFQDLVLHFAKVELGSVVKPNEAPFLTDHQIYLFGASSTVAGGYFFGMQQPGDPIKIV